MGCDRCIFADECARAEMYKDMDEEDCIEFDDNFLDDPIYDYIGGEYYWGEMSWRKLTDSILDLFEEEF